MLGLRLDASGYRSDGWDFTFDALGFRPNGWGFSFVGWDFVFDLLDFAKTAGGSGLPAGTLPLTP